MAEHKTWCPQTPACACACGFPAPTAGIFFIETKNTHAQGGPSNLWRAATRLTPAPHGARQRGSRRPIQPPGAPSAWRKRKYAGPADTCKTKRKQ
eukprot:9012394-Alexandrium_andersonii.AAC.1